MAADQTLTQLTWDQEAVNALQPSIEASPFGGTRGPSDVLQGANLWEFRDGSVRVLLAVRGEQHTHGRALVFVGMRSLGDRFRTSHLTMVANRLASQHYAADVVSMCTVHPHIVRACERDGWTKTGEVVIKHVGTL